MTSKTGQFERVVAYGMRAGEISKLIGVCVDDGWRGEGWYGSVSPGVFVGPCATREATWKAIREIDEWDGKHGA